MKTKMLFVALKVLVLILVITLIYSLMLPLNPVIVTLLYLFVLTFGITHVIAQEYKLED